MEKGSYNCLGAIRRVSAQARQGENRRATFVRVASTLDRSPSVAVNYLASDGQETIGTAELLVCGAHRP